MTSTRDGVSSEGGLPDASRSGVSGGRPPAPVTFLFYCCIATSSPRWSITPTASVQQLSGHFAAILGELPHHLLVQPDVHRSGVVQVARVAELARECSPLGETVVDAD